MTLEKLRHIIDENGFGDRLQYNDTVADMAIDCLDSAIKERDKLKAKVDMYEQALMQSAHELVSCPFCGESEDISILARRYHGGVVEIRGDKFWRVECLQCDCRTGDFFDADYDGDGRSAAIEAWHRRQQNSKELEILNQAFEESDYDLVTCAKCGRWVLDLPDGLSYCRECAEKLEEEQEGGRG